jgi:hypothetical protein
MQRTGGLAARAITRRVMPMSGLFVIMALPVLWRGRGATSQPRGIGPAGGCAFRFHLPSTQPRTPAWRPDMRRNSSTTARRGRSCFKTAPIPTRSNVLPPRPLVQMMCDPTASSPKGAGFGGRGQVGVTRTGTEGVQHRGYSGSRAGIRARSAAPCTGAQRR